MAASASNIPDVTTNPFASAQMALNYGPQTQQALRRSQYLADALRQQMTPAQNPHSYGEVAARLLATAILQRANDKGQDALIQAMTQDRQGFDKTLLAGTPLDPSAQTPPASGAPSMPAAPPPQTPPAAASAAAPASTPAGPVISDADKLALARTVWGEARGEPATGQQAVASVILNRARESGQPVGQVVAAPHQFSGYGGQALNVSPDQLQPIMANIAPALSGQDPTNGADHFFNPQLANPSWGQGPGQMIGQHKFMALGYGGGQPGAPPAPPQMPTGNAGGPPPPPPPPDPNGPPVQNVPPYQVASAGMTPPPPQGAPGNAMQGPGAPAPMPQPQAAQPQQGVPTQYVSPQEWQNAAALLGNWRTHDLGVQQLMALKQRAASPVDMKPGTYWGADGKPHAVEQFQDVPGAPNAFVQRSNLDNSVHVEANPAYGTVPSGSVMGGNGTLSNVPIQARDRYRLPGSPGWYVTDEHGNPTKVADDAFSVKDAGGLLQDLTKSEQFQKATHATDMYRAAANAAQRPGGMPDAELIDFAAQEISGGVARQFNQHMLENAQGPLARLKQYAPQLVSGQRLSPEARQALLQTMRDYAQEAQGTFGSLAKAQGGFAAAQGMPVDQFIAPLMRPLPDLPQIGQIPNGMHPANAPGPAARIDGASPQTAFRPQSNADFEKIPNGSWFINPADHQPMRKQR